MKQRTTLFLKFSILLIGLFILLSCIFWLPQLAHSATKVNPEYRYLKYPVLVGIYVTSLPFFLSLVEAFTLLRTIERRTAFPEVAGSSLEIFQNYTYVIMGLYIFGLLFLGFQDALHPGIAIIGFSIIFASLVIAVFSAILQELLKTANEIKSENDLTV
ncbi:DUF2975 domain-containing protein [Bacillus sp. 2205SS5-2]|uniref:DUF2975 domain-containing protein n=1 Tax=Bacillus sp. 2205SS5-2 TaxID=3109031 RepID=UPI003003E71F